MTRLQLERWQVAVYAVAIAAGCAVGWWLPELGPVMERALWPVLAGLLYVTFVQVPLDHLADAVRDRRFLGALLVTNFLIVPALVWLLARVLPGNGALVLGVYLVLLVPCTDWYVSFTLLGGGDARRATASTPALLLAQMVALPAYLWLFMGREFTGLVRAGAFVEAFFGLIATPLLMALATEWAAHRSELVARWRVASAWWPVPMLAAVVFLIAGAQVREVADAAGQLGAATLVFVVYAGVIPFVARWVGRRYRLDVPAQRTLVFSAGTRNSFVVLPFALALPAEWRLAVAVVVLQSVVELVAMVIYLWWVPRRLLPERAPS
ncbi:MAG: arsenic resistance protein [Verrucomicrobiae bacterium]|nr:arsenic resistance protein [Verrucomicrobiae bacterium]